MFTLQFLEEQALFGIPPLPPQIHEVVLRFGLSFNGGHFARQDQPNECSRMGTHAHLTPHFSWATELLPTQIFLKISVSVLLPQDATPGCACLCGIKSKSPWPSKGVLSSSSEFHTLALPEAKDPDHSSLKVEIEGLCTLQALKV